MVHIQGDRSNGKKLQQEVQQALQCRREAIGLQWLECDPSDNVAIRECTDRGIRKALESGHRDIAWTTADNVNAWLQISVDTRFQIGGQKRRPVEKLRIPHDADQGGMMHDAETFHTPWGIVLLTQGPTADEMLARLEEMIWQHTAAHQQRAVQYSALRFPPCKKSALTQPQISLKSRRSST